MAIDKDIVIKIDEGEVIMENMELRTWAIDTEMDGKSPPDQAKILFSKIRDVKNLFYSNGDAVTLSSLLDGRAPLSFFIALKNAWVQRSFNGGEAEAKNG